MREGGGDGGAAVRRGVGAAVLACLLAAAAPAAVRAQQPSGAAGASAGVPAQLVGKWRGLAGTGEAKSVEQVRTATVTKDFGHLVDEFEFEVAEDGAITGSGKATYWFNVTPATCAHGARRACRSSACSRR
jgi:hypothetical protein